jgi:CubicO group peptidase (beta-lactamase class C family)
VTAGELRDVLAELCAEHRVPGAQLALRTSSGTVTVEYGVRSLESGGTVARDTVFPVGSLTKPFTAALAMVLVEDGDLDLDDPLAEEFPEFGAGKLVTLRQLLTHTSGLASNVGEEEAERAGSRLRWVKAHATAGDLVHRPGTAFSYSNPGYVVAGALTEAVTGMEWREALGAVLLEPLGIGPAFATGPRSGADRPGVEGHTVRQGRERIVGVREQLMHAVEDPDGALAVSAADLTVFASLFLGSGGHGGPLSASGAALMVRDQLDGVRVGPFGMADGWGLGLARYADVALGRDLYGHDGTLDGVSCHLRFDPAGGTALALTTNANTGQEVWNALCTRLAGRGLPTVAGLGAGVRSAPLAAAPDDCLGRYENGAADVTVQQAPEGRLLLASEGRPAYVLDCREGLEFTLRDIEGGPEAFAGRFLTDPDTGRIDSIQFSGRLARRAPGDGMIHNALADRASASNTSAQNGTSQ